MADIELVIKIDEKDYKKALELRTREAEWNNMHSCYEAVLNGTQLPKGHGRLIEVNENLYQEIRKWVGVGRAFELLDNAPTIIEADKESEVQE